MSKFELLCQLKAISSYAYDIHYSAEGKNFYSDHIFSERLADIDVEDDYIETMYLGESEDAPSSVEINEQVASMTPEVTPDTQTNFKALRDMIVSALMMIQNYDYKTKAEEDLLGSVAHILQRHNGLLFRQLKYTPEEIQNSDDDIDWITVRGNHIPIKKGQTKDEAVKSFFESKKDKGSDSNKTEETESTKEKGFWVFGRDGTAEKFAKTEAEANDYISRQLEPIYGEQSKNKELREKEYKIEKHDESNKRHKTLIEGRIKDMEDSISELEGQRSAMISASEPWKEIQKIEKNIEYKKQKLKELKG